MSDFIETLLAVGQLEADRHQDAQFKARVDEARILRSVAETTDREAANRLASERIAALISGK